MSRPALTGSLSDIHGKLRWHLGRSKQPWIVQLLARRATKVAAVALANKMARMAWAVMAKGERYREPVILQAA